jgi:CHAT domain
MRAATRAAHTEGASRCCLPRLASRTFSLNDRADGRQDWGRRRHPNFAQQIMAITSSGMVRKDCSYQMPGRILLSACDTAGRAARHSGEWLALAPAMMWAGARLVIATSWPTIDDPRTLEMDLALIEVLKNHDDPAEALRSLQVEKLQRWRDGMDDKDPLSPICGWSPLFWAPYIAVGFRQG